MTQTIKSRIGYEVASERVHELWDAEPHTPEGKERDALFDAVEKYEAEHYPIGEPESYAAVEYHLERLNLTVEDLPITEGEKALLKKCIGEKILIPESLLNRLSYIFGVPREVL